MAQPEKESRSEYLKRINSSRIGPDSEHFGKTTKESPIEPLLGFGALGVLIAFLFYVFGANDPVVSDERRAEFNLENAAISAVKARMKDPNSADISIVSTNGEYACGFVNGKNSFGGMTGKQAFVYSSLAGAILVSDNTELYRTMAVRC